MSMVFLGHKPIICCVQFPLYPIFIKSSCLKLKRMPYIEGCRTLRNRTLKLISAVVVTATIFVGCMPARENVLASSEIDFVQLKSPVTGQDIATIKTTLGDIKIMLFEKEAPKTVAHFKKLVDSGFYDKKPIFNKEGLTAFITGALDDKCMEGKIVTDDKKPIKSEITPNLWHFSGAVSSYGVEKGILNKEMVSDSRFFVVGDVKATPEFVGEMEKYEYPTTVINAYKENGGLPQYTGYYTVFAQVIEGMEIVNSIILAKADGEIPDTEMVDASITSVSISPFAE